MRQAGMVRAGGRSGVGNGEEDRKAEDRKAEGGTADGRRTDGREAEGRKRDGGMGKLSLIHISRAPCIFDEWGGQRSC